MKLRSFSQLLNHHTTVAKMVRALRQDLGNQKRKKFDLYFYFRYLQVIPCLQYFLCPKSGSDTRNSNFIFPFASYQSLMECRDALSAFHIPEGVAAEYHLPVPAPMASAWIILETATLATDYKRDVSFFFRH